MQYDNNKADINLSGLSNIDSLKKKIVKDRFVGFLSTETILLYKGFFFKYLKRKKLNILNRWNEIKSN